MLTVAGLIATVVFNDRALKAQRGALRAQRHESVTSNFLALNHQLQELLYALLEEEPNILKATELAILKPFQFRFFHIIDIFSDMYQLREMIKESDHRLWERTEARIHQIARKPAFQCLWQKQLKKNPELFSADFALEMNRFAQALQNRQVDEAPV